MMKSLALLLVSMLALATSGHGRAAEAVVSDRDGLRKAIRVAEASARPPMISRGKFLLQPAVTDARLSPDGRYLSYFRRKSQGAELWLQEVATGRRFRLMADAAASGQRWSGDGRRLWLADRHGLAVVAPDIRRMRRILKWDSARHQRLFDIPPPASAYALVEERVGEGSAQRYRYLRVDEQGRTQLLHAARLPVRKLMLRQDGSLAVAAAYEGPQYDTVIRRYGRDGIRELARCHGIERCDPIGFAEMTGAVWMLTQRGEDRASLQRWQPDRPTWTTVHRDPADIADADDILWNRSDWQAIAYYGAKRRWHGNGAVMRSQLAALQKHFPEANLQLTLSPAGPWLVKAEQSNWPSARHFLYAASGHRLQALFTKDETIPGLPDARNLSAALPLTWRASDGMRLHGYVYLPRGVPLARAPMIAWLHGGPFSREHEEYDPRIQLLANRGYVVFVPNFRGSTGYGLRYQRAARGDVANGRVLRDIVDGLDFLLGNGIGDRKRQALAGHSFGGYAGLLAVSHHPTRFAFVFAGAAPTDYGWQKHWQAQNESPSLSDGPPVALSFPQHGLPFTDPAWRSKMLRESPLANLPAIRASMYLWAGARDDRTPVKSIAHFAGEAKRNRKAIVLLVDPQAGHVPESALGSEAWVYLLENAAHRHFGGGLTAPSAPLRTFVDERLEVGALSGHESKR